MVIIISIRVVKMLFDIDNSKTLTLNQTLSSFIKVIHVCLLIA